MPVTRGPIRLVADHRGAALIEFALALPVILAMGGYGVELSNLAITHMRINQIALAAADNASRIGVGKDNISPYQVQEGDVNDVLRGAQQMGAGLNLTTYGRITLSSLENVQRDFSDGTKSDTGPVQRLHWQRCLGSMTGVGTSAAPVYDSSYGQATPLATAGTDTTAGNAGVSSAGMGSNPVVNAPATIGVVFVEVNYQYQPLFGSMFAKKQLIHYTASFIVRDNRNYSQLFQVTTAAGTPTRMVCSKPWATMPSI